MTDELQLRSNAGPPPTRWAIAGGIAGLLPFLIHSTAESVTTVNGAVTTFAYRDPFAIGGGALAIVLGIIAVALGLRRNRETRAIGLGIAAIVIGGFQIARGFGAFAHAETGATTTVVLPPPHLPPDPTAPCESGSACIALGQVRKDNNRYQALAAFKRACEFRDASGCFEAAIAANAPSDPATTQLYQRACDLGLAAGCTNVATAYLLGDGAPKDQARALTMLVAACESHDPVGCRNASVIYRDGLGVAKDPQKTGEFAAKACDRSALGEAPSCITAGVSYAAAPERAYVYFTKACDRDPATCHDLGLVTSNGIGTRKDPVAARAIYAKACNARSFPSCNNLGILLRDGVGGPKDLDGARGFFQQACNGGEQLGCANLTRK